MGSSVYFTVDPDFGMGFVFLTSDELEFVSKLGTISIIVVLIRCCSFFKFI